MPVLAPDSSGNLEQNLNPRQNKLLIPTLVFIGFQELHGLRGGYGATESTYTKSVVELFLERDESK